MNSQQVIIVNENDESLGVMEKMQAHEQGVLHRAFSIFIFDSEGRMLLQQRAGKKYHGAWLWTNACCSHPMPGETVEDAAVRRLKEELGIEIPISRIFSFLYREPVENNLIEHEYDHVFAGEYGGELQPAGGEVAVYKYEDMEMIKSSIEKEPGKFTSWFKIAFPKIENWWQQQYFFKNKIV